MVFCEIDRKNFRARSSVVLVAISLYAESHLTVNSGVCYSYFAIMNEREVMNVRIVKKGVKKSEKYTRKPKVYHEEEFKEIYASKTMKVVMRNCLALGKFPNMNLEQEKLLGIALADAHSRGEFYYYRCEITKLAKMIGYDKSSANKLANSLSKDVVIAGEDLVGSLMTSYVIVTEEGKERASFISLFEKVVIEKENSKLYIYFRLNRELKPYVLKQTGNFCILALDLFTKSTSPYSIRLGRVLSAKVMRGEEKEVSFTKEELAEVLKLPDFYKDNYYETKRIILERAIKEVNYLEEGVKIVSFSRLAEGRKYVGVSFVVKKG